ncbi:MAG: hypothetical protein AB2805_05730 [Candidatus Thiodiazotropha sp.]
MYPLIFGFSGKEEAELSLRELAGADTEEGQMLVRMIAESSETTRTDLGYRIIEQPRIEGRFHHIGFSLEQDKTNVCVRCHGTVPHDQSKEIRSFLNMHVFYLACETCHVQAENGQEAWKFRWYSKQNGKAVANPPQLVEIDRKVRRSSDDFERKYVAYGDYGAKVAPGFYKEDRFRFVNGEEEMVVTEKYLEQKSELTADQQSQMRKVIHKKVTEDPLPCDQCHRGEDPYIPFAKLGYPPRRVRQLQSTNVVSMIRKYKEFYIPSFLRPGEGQR